MAIRFCWLLALINLFWISPSLADSRVTLRYSALAYQSNWNRINEFNATDGSRARYFVFSNLPGVMNLMDFKLKRVPDLIGYEKSDHPRKLSKKGVISEVASTQNQISPGEFSDRPIIWKDWVTGMELILIKGGCFTMGDTFSEGDSDELPLHKVCLSDFYMGKFEVTQKEWKKVMKSNPSGDDDSEKNPVEEVSWQDTQLFIEKLNKKSGERYRLPTEAEWEYACRERGRNIRYGTGTNEINDDIANYDDLLGDPDPVGSYAPNSLGLYDMSGNVWEWVNDVYERDYYRHSPQNNPKGSGQGFFRVSRGGSWHEPPKRQRCTDRLKRKESRKGVPWFSSRKKNLKDR